MPLSEAIRRIGGNNADNAYSSDLIAANADGTLLERLEYVQTDLLALPRCVAKLDGAVLTGNDNIFVVSGGPVKAQIFGLVTTVIGGASNGRLKHTTTAPAATVDLNAGAVAIDADAVGTLYHNVGATGVFTPSSGLGFKIIDPVTVEDVWYLLAPGTTHFNGSAAQTGVIAWFMRYIPLSPLSRVAAAA